MKCGQSIKLHALQKPLKRRERVVRFGDEFDTGDRKKRFKPFVLKKPIWINKEDMALARPRASGRGSQPCTQVGDVGQGGLEDDDDVQGGTPAGDGCESADAEGKHGYHRTIQARIE